MLSLTLGILRWGLGGWGISLAPETQQNINAPHLAQTQIAFFHRLPVLHTSFLEPK